MTRLERVQLYLVLLVLARVTGESSSSAHSRLLLLLRGLRAHLGYPHPAPGFGVLEAASPALADLAAALVEAANGDNGKAEEVAAARILKAVRGNPYLTTARKVLWSARAGRGGHLILARLVRDGRVERGSDGCFRVVEPQP